jgi:hypothetical protein
MAESETDTETPPAPASDGPFRGDLVANAGLAAAAADLAKRLPADLAGKLVITTDGDTSTSFALARSIEAAVADQLRRAKRAAGKTTLPADAAERPPRPALWNPEQFIQALDLTKSVVEVLTPTITTTKLTTTPADFELVSVVAAAVSRPGLTVISESTRELTKEAPPLPDLVLLDVEIDKLELLKGAAEKDLAAVKGATTASNAKKESLQTKIAGYAAAIEEATEFVTGLVAPPAEGETTPLLTAIRYLSIDDAQILVVTATPGQVQQSTVSRFGRTPEFVLDGFARIPFQLLAVDGAMATSGVATGSTSFYAAFDAHAVRLRWSPIVDTGTPSLARSGAPSWLKLAAAAVAGLVVIAAFSLPFVVLDKGLATGTAEPFDHNYLAHALTVASAWQIGILVAPLIFALLALAVRSGSNSWPVAVLAIAGTIAAGILQAVEFGLSHLVVYVAGAYLPAILLIIAATIEYRIGPKGTWRQRFRLRF